MAKEFTFGMKQRGISESGLKIPVAEKDSFGGPTETITLEIGRTIKGKGSESKSGPPAKSMRVNGKMIKKKDKEFFIGLTAINTKAISVMGRFMASEL